MYFQELILTLQKFWVERGCLLAVYLALGTVAGYSLFAMYLPIFKMGQVV